MQEEKLDPESVLGKIIKRIEQLEKVVGIKTRFCDVCDAEMPGLCICKKNMDAEYQMDN